MAVAISLQAKDVTRRRVARSYKLVFSANYTTGGETIDFTKTTNPLNLEVPKWSRVPTDFSVENFPSGFAAEIIPATTLTGWKLKITDNTNAGAELAQAGYPAGLTTPTDIRVKFSGPVGV